MQPHGQPRHGRLTGGSATLDAIGTVGAGSIFRRAVLSVGRPSLSGGGMVTACGGGQQRAKLGELLGGQPVRAVNDLADAVAGRSVTRLPARLLGVLAPVLRGPLRLR